MTHSDTSYLFLARSPSFNLHNLLLLLMCVCLCAHTYVQHLFSFDETHPGIASQHYKRSNKQEAVLQQERRELEVKRRK